MLSTHVIAIALLFAVVQSPAAPRRGGNPDAANVKNAVPASAESVAAGKRSYQRLCSRCHGAEGKGDGTGSSGAQPSDLTDPQWDFGSSDGEIFGVIHDGTSDDMAGYASRLSDTEIWNVMNYLRTLAPKP